MERNNVVNTDGSIDWDKIGSFDTQLAEKARIISIEKFGGVGDGITDNTNALLSAISYAKTNKSTIFIPNGIFVVLSAQKVLIDFDVFQLKGNGKYNSKISFKNATGGFLYKKPVTTSWIYKPTFDDIAIIGTNLCNTLVTFENTISEMNITNCYFGESLVSIFKFTNMSGVYIDNSDIVNAPIGFEVDIVGILNISGLNIFNVRKVFSITTSIVYMRVNGSTYIEKCDIFLHGKSTFVGIGHFVMTDCNMLHNNGTQSPFTFESLDFITKFIIRDCYLNIQTICGSIFNLIPVRVVGIAFITIKDSVIQRGAIGQLTNLINVASGSSSNSTRLLIDNSMLPPIMDDDFIIGNRGILSIVSTEFNYAVNNGIRLSLIDSYAGRLYYNNINDFPYIKNKSDIGRKFMLYETGTTVNRPTTDLFYGRQYFDWDLGIPIYVNKYSTGWINAMGTVV